MKDFLTYFVLPMCFGLATLIIYEKLSVDYKTPVFEQKRACEKHLEDINAPRSKYCHVFVTYEIKDLKDE